MQDLSAALALAARSVADVLGRRGHRAWIVGGAPRDLALGRAPVEVDMTSAAPPEEVEAAFERTIPVGRSFGTVIVRTGTLDVQVTTFRSEAGYADARRPDRVAYGETLEGDSARRDFTCNALYLDPLDDDFQDPQGGLLDLEARRLRCVGDARTRFEEDGLRLLRLARFAAVLDLEPDPASLEAARASADALRGVSPERVLQELEAALRQPGGSGALDRLTGLGLLGRAIPALADFAAAEGGVEAFWAVRRPLFDHLAPAPGLALGLATLCDAGSRPEAGLEVVRSLRPSRELLREIAAIGAHEANASAALDGSRSARVRWMRDPAFESGWALARARARIVGRSTEPLEAASAERARLGHAGLHPDPWLGAEDLVHAGIVPGPFFGEVLREAETLQLDGALVSRAEALSWLARRAGQDGGKTPRSA
jgi:tRNA nucleotidyltransferase/poly(A) polymerase